MRLVPSPTEGNKEREDITQEQGERALVIPVPVTSGGRVRILLGEIKPGMG